MRAMTSQVAIVERANELAEDLCSGPVPVERNTLLSVVADFLSDPKAPTERLERTLTLLASGSGGHLNRSKGFKAQATEVIRVVGQLLRSKDYAPESLRSLLGWTARLLLVRRPAKPGRRGEIGGGRPTPQSFPGPRPTKPLPKPPTRSVPATRPPDVAPVPTGPNWRPRLQGLGWGNITEVAIDLMTTLEGDDKREAAKAIVVKMGGKREFRSRKDKPWVQDLFAAAGE